MTPRELLAELHRRGISVHVTDDGHVRLTGPVEAALTPALRSEVVSQRQGLVLLLGAEDGGPADAATVERPVSPDTPAAAAPPGGSSGLLGWLLWGGLAALGVGLGAAHLLGRPAASAPAAPSPAPLPGGWPYTGQRWVW